MSQGCAACAQLVSCSKPLPSARPPSARAAGRRRWSTSRSRTQGRTRAGGRDGELAANGLPPLVRRRTRAETSAMTRVRRDMGRAYAPAFGESRRGGRVVYSGFRGHPHSKRGRTRRRAARLPAKDQGRPERAPLGARHAHRDRARALQPARHRRAAAPGPKAELDALGADPRRVRGRRRAGRLRAAARGARRGASADASTRSWRSGAVIRGETDHYEHIAREAAAGLAAVSRETRRAGGLRRADREARGPRARPRRRLGPDNKGAEAARAAVRDGARAARAVGRARAARAAERGPAHQGDGSAPSRSSTSGTSAASRSAHVLESFWRVRTSTDATRARWPSAWRAGAQARAEALDAEIAAAATQLALRAHRRRRQERSCASAPTSCCGGGDTPAGGGDRRGGGAGQALRRGGLARVRERRAGRDHAQARARRGRAATAPRTKQER